MNEKSQKAKAFFLEGYGCGQAVLMAFAEEIGLPLETAVRIGAPLGGGVGRMREICGCVSAMAIVAGLKNAVLDPKDLKAKEALYKFVQSLAEDFKKETGSVVCRELLGLPSKNPSAPTPEPRTQQYYKKRPCPEMVSLAAEILENRFSSQNPQGANHEKE